MTVILVVTYPYRLTGRHIALHDHFSFLQVDIGEGVLIDKTVLNRLRAHCRGAPAKFARNLLRHLFTNEELQGKSLFGKGSNVRKDVPPKEALDPVRVNAIIGMYISHMGSSLLIIDTS